MSDLSASTIIKANSTPKSFPAFGFDIPIGADGRRVWPVVFKKFICTKLDTGGLSRSEVLNACQVDPSTLRDWRRKWGKPARERSTGRKPKIAAVGFSELQLSDTPSETAMAQIVLKAGRCELRLPPNYPPRELGVLVRMIEAGQ
jgi:transposase-like protein